MNGRFSAFSFVDRIARCTPGVRIEGQYTVPPHVTRFPDSLMAEAVGQLAAWSAMAHLDFAWRPVAGLAGETRYHGEAVPGKTLTLEADLARCDAEAVAYSGRASIDGRCVLELIDCVGPMLPMPEFDSPDAVRADFELLFSRGTEAGRFGGVPAPQVAVTAHDAGQRISATLQVPARDDADYFDDHFPRRPVFPGTLLMDAFAELALPLAAECAPLRRSGPLAIARVTHVKIRSFTAPATQLQLEAEVLTSAPKFATLKLTARAEGKTVAGARVEVYGSAQ